MSFTSTHHSFVRRLALTSFLIAGLVLTGCEGAGAPLGEPDEMAVDMAVTGTWYAAGEGDDAAWLRIWAFNDHEYYVEWETQDDEDDTARMRVFSSDLDTYLFANMQCVNCDEDDRREWFFFQYELESPDVLLIRGIEDAHYSDAMAQMTRSRDVRQYVERHMGDPGFFSDDIMRMTRFIPEESTD